MFDIITIGTASRDIFLKSDQFKILHAKKGRDADYEAVPLGSKIDVGEMFFSTGGAATNAAITFARQGFQTCITARLGNDASATDIRQELLKDGVDVSRLVTDWDHTTAHAIVLSHKSAERTILAHGGASRHWALRDLHQRPLDARWFYISSLGGDFEMLEEAMTIAKKHNIRVALNPGVEEIKLPHKLVPSLFSVDVLIMNREEGAKLTGVAVENEREIFKRIDELEPGIFVMTDGPKGVWVSDNKHLYKAGVYDERLLVDRTGAGDAFGSGFVSGLIRRLEAKSSGVINSATLMDLEPPDIAYSVRLGSANATSCVEGMGAKHGLLTRQQFEKGLRWHGLEIRMGDIPYKIKSK